MKLWEETGKSTMATAGVGVQASGEGTTGNKVGKVLLTSSGRCKLQRLVEQAEVSETRGNRTGT